VSRRGRVVLAALGLASAALGAARAADGAAEAPAVEITVIGSAADFRRVREVVEPRQLGVAAVSWTRADKLDPAEVLGLARREGGPLRCWVDLTDGRRARLYFAARSGERFLMRDVELPAGSGELARQALGEVLALSVAALLEDERAGLSRAEAQALLASRAPAPPPPPPPAVTPAPAVVAAAPPPVAGGGCRVCPGVFYAAEARGGGLPLAHGPGLSVDWAVTGGPRALVLWLGGQLQLPGHARGDSVGVGLSAVAARAGGAVRWRLGAGGERALAPRALDLRVGAGADVVEVTPEPGTVDASATLSPAWRSTSLVATGAVALGVSAGRHAALEARLYADLAPVLVHYDLDLEGRTTAAFSPWRVRPGLALAITLR
jgi:hypothetical protein